MSKGGPLNLRDLIALTGVPERQIRFLIAEGFVPAPRGGRAHADYGDDHVAAIRRYTRLHALGFPPAAVRILLQAEEGVPFPVAPGVTLVVSPKLIGSGTPTAPLLERVQQILAEFLQEAEDDDPPARADD